MTLDIQEMTGEALAVDLHALKAEIVAEVVRRVEEERRLAERMRDERAIGNGGSGRARELG